MNQNEKTETLKVMLDNGAFVPVRAHEDDAGLDPSSPTYQRRRDGMRNIR